MMRKSLKSKVLSIMFCLCLLMFSCFMFSLNTTVAKADSGFVMTGGASVRMDTPSGIKYQATISESTYDASAEYGILIVPTDYLTKHDIQDKYIEKLTDAGYNNLAIVKTSPVQQKDGSYLLTGSIVNIYESNFNRAFTGIAFSVKDEVYTYATANDNSRSIMTVASRYLTATENPPSDDQKSKLIEIIGGKKIGAEEVNLSINEDMNYVGKIKFDAFLPSADDNFTVALMPEDSADYAKFTLSTTSSYEGVVRSELGNGWYSFTFDTQKINDYITVNSVRSDVITSISISNATDNVIIANVRNSALEIAKYSDAYVGSPTYFATSISAANDFDGDNYSLKVTAKAHSDSIGAQQRGKDNVIYVPFDGSVPTNGAVITWKAKVDKNSFVKLDESIPTINYTSFYKNGLLTNNATWFGNPATGVGTLTNSNEDANGWVTYTLTITKEQISTFFTEEGYVKLVCMNTGAVLFNNGNWTSSTSTGYEFYVDDFRVVTGEFVGAYVGNTTHFAVDYSNDANFTTSSDGSSLKVTAKAASSWFSSGNRNTNAAIYLPFSGSVPTSNVVVTWKAKVDTNSFKNIDGSVATTLDMKRFNEAAMLTNNITAFDKAKGETGTLTYTAGENGWVNYSLSISKEQIPVFFSTAGYFKLVCMNVVATVKDSNGGWTAASGIGYEFYVDDFNVQASEFLGSYVGNGKYFAVSYSNDANFVSSNDGSSLKVTAKAVAFGAVDGSGATGRMANIAIYLPYGNALPTTAMTVTWKVKLDRNSFIDCDDTQGVNTNVLNSYCSTFLKAGLLSVNSAAYETTGATLTVPTAEDANGWYSYSLSVPASDISKVFVQGTDGNYYLRLVCLNVGPALTNNSSNYGSWAAASTMGYDFYVDELTFTVNN